MQTDPTDDHQLIIGTVLSMIGDDFLVDRSSEIGIVAVDRRSKLEKKRVLNCDRVHPYLFTDDVRKDRRRLRCFGFRGFSVIDQRDEKWIEILSFLETEPNRSLSSARERVVTEPRFEGDVERP